MSKGPIARSWEEYRKLCIRRELTEAEEEELREAWCAGAATLYMGILKGLSAGPGESAGDLLFMHNVQREVTAIGQLVDLRHLAAKGRA